MVIRVILLYGDNETNYKYHISIYTERQKPCTTFLTFVSPSKLTTSNLSIIQMQPMETVLRKTRESTGVNCRNVRRRVRCQ